MICYLKRKFPDETKYGTSQPMSGYKIERAYQNAPPMIPHDVEGMLDITPEIIRVLVVAMQLLLSLWGNSIPKSHYIDFRPKHKLEGEKFVKSYKDNDEKMKFQLNLLIQFQMQDLIVMLVMHPQSTGELAVENTFKPDFHK